MLKAGGTRLKALEVVSWKFDEGGVNLCVIGIFVIVDAVTIDKLANRCYICCELDRSKNGPFRDTGVGLSYKRRRLIDTDEK